jgi:hypothetical protein
MLRTGHDGFFTLYHAEVVSWWTWTLPIAVVVAIAVAVVRTIVIE